LRYVEQAVAVGLTRRSAVVFSHRTALAINGFPFLPPWPDEVDVLEQPASSRRSKRGIRTHHSTFADGDVRAWGEFWVTTPARTLADIALWLGPVFSVPALDAGLSRVSRHDIRAALDRVGGKHLARATRALDFADPVRIAGRVGKPGADAAFRRSEAAAPGAAPVADPGNALLQDRLRVA
jgi:hypothetical protein